MRHDPQERSETTSGQPAAVFMWKSGSTTGRARRSASPTRRISAGSRVPAAGSCWGSPNTALGVAVRSRTRTHVGARVAQAVIMCRGSPAAVAEWGCGAEGGNVRCRGHADELVPSHERLPDVLEAFPRRLVPPALVGEEVPTATWCLRSCLSRSSSGVASLEECVVPMSIPYTARSPGRLRLGLGRSGEVRDGHPQGVRSSHVTPRKKTWQWSTWAIRSGAMG